LDIYPLFLSLVVIVLRETILFKKFFNTEDKRRLFSNFVSLSILQGANYILPLITLPYLVRVLGPEKFGLIAFAQAFIQYFNILTDYGFNLSATREISIHRENKEKISEIFSSVIIIKFGLLILSLTIMTIIVFSFERFRQDWLIYYLTFGMVIGQALFPVWFFQGMERMKYITFLNITAKVIFTISIFIFVHKVSDYIYVPILNSLGYLVAGLIGIFIVLNDFNIKIHFLSFKTLKEVLINGFHFFISRVSVSIYTSTNIFVLGIFTDNKTVGYYSMAEKLYMAIQSIYYPLTNALYPYISHNKNIELFKKIFYIVVFFNIIATIILFIFIEDIMMLFFGKDIYLSVNIFKILLISLLAVVPSILVGYPFLAALGYGSLANYSVVFASILHLVFISVLALFELINVYNIALLVVFTETIVLMIRFYGIYKNKLWGNYKI